MKIEPFTVAVAEEVLTDLRERIERTRWPDHIPGSGWQYGADVEYLRSLLSSWTEFDWRPALRNNRPDRIALDWVLDPRRRTTALLQPPAPPRQHAPLERPLPPLVGRPSHRRRRAPVRARVPSRIRAGRGTPSSSSEGSAAAPAESGSTGTAAARSSRRASPSIHPRPSRVERRREPLLGHVLEAAQDGEPPPRHAPNPLRRRSRT